MRNATLALALTALASAPAAPAAAGSAGFRLVAQTPHASYFAQGRSRVDVERSEAFLARLFELFGPAPEGWRFEYYVHPASGDLRAGSGAHAVGLTDLVRNRVDSVRPYHPHELVHAVAGRLGRCPVFFAEGLAVALSSFGRWGERGVDDVARDALASGRTLEPYFSSFETQDPSLAYPLAGSFVAFLLERDGIDPFVDFLVRCGTSGRGSEGAFRQAFGRSIARARIEWQAALRRETGTSWAWADPATWPGSLRENVAGAPGAAAVRVAAAPPAAEATGGAAAGASLLLSAESGESPSPVLTGRAGWR